MHVQLTLWVVLLLAVCLCGLAVYLASENLSMSYQSSTNKLVEGAERCDDLSSPSPCQVFEVNNLYGIPMPAVFLPRASLSLAPRLPPPDF